MLYDYQQQCDADNNPGEVIDADMLRYYLKLKVVRRIKGILLDIFLMRTAAQFNEIDEYAF